MDCQNMRVKGICIVNLPLTFSVLIKTFTRSETFLAFTIFIEVRSLKACNFIKKGLQHRYFPVKFAKFSRAPPILKNIYERLLLIFFNFNSYYLLLSVQNVLLKMFCFTTYHHTKIKRIKELQ